MNQTLLVIAELPRDTVAKLDDAISVRVLLPRYEVPQTMATPIRSKKLVAAEALLEFNNVARKWVDQALAQHSSSFSRVKLLMFLDANGPSRMSAIATALEIAVRSAIDAVESLERAGMIVRTNDPTNRRAVLATMTPAGREALREALRVRERVLNEMFGDITAAETIQLLHILTKLRAKITKR